MRQNPALINRYEPAPGQALDENSRWFFKDWCVCTASIIFWTVLFATIAIFYGPMDPLYYTDTSQITSNQTQCYWPFFGCYVTSGSDPLISSVDMNSSNAWASNNLTAETCFAFCQAQSYVLAVASTDCNSACAGDANEICGGSMAMSIYTCNMDTPIRYKLPTPAPAAQETATEPSVIISNNSRNCGDLTLECNKMNYSYPPICLSGLTRCTYEVTWWAACNKAIFNITQVIGINRFMSIGYSTLDVQPFGLMNSTHLTITIDNVGHTTVTEELVVNTTSGNLTFSPIAISGSLLQVHSISFSGGVLRALISRPIADYVDNSIPLDTQLYFWFNVAGGNLSTTNNNNDNNDNNSATITHGRPLLSSVKNFQSLSAKNDQQMSSTCFASSTNLPSSTKQQQTTPPTNCPACQPASYLYPQGCGIKINCSTEFAMSAQCDNVVFYFVTKMSVNRYASVGFGGISKVIPDGMANSSMIVIGVDGNKVITVREGIVRMDGNKFLSFDPLDNSSVPVLSGASYSSDGVLRATVSRPILSYSVGALPLNAPLTYWFNPDSGGPFVNGLPTGLSDSITPTPNTITQPNSCYSTPEPPKARSFTTSHQPIISNASITTTTAAVSSTSGEQNNCGKCSVNTWGYPPNCPPNDMNVCSLQVVWFPECDHVVFNLTQRIGNGRVSTYTSIGFGNSSVNSALGMINSNQILIGIDNIALNVIRLWEALVVLNTSTNTPVFQTVSTPALDIIGHTLQNGILNVVFTRPIQAYASGTWSLNQPLYYCFMVNPGIYSSGLLPSILANNLPHAVSPPFALPSNCPLSATTGQASHSSQEPLMTSTITTISPTRTTELTTSTSASATSGTILFQECGDCISYQPSGCGQRGAISNGGNHNISPSGGVLATSASGLGPGNQGVVTPSAAPATTTVKPIVDCCGDCDTSMWSTPMSCMENSCVYSISWTVKCHDVIFNLTHRNLSTNMYTSVGYGASNDILNGLINSNQIIVKINGSGNIAVQETVLAQEGFSLIFQTVANSAQLRLLSSSFVGAVLHATIARPVLAYASGTIDLNAPLFYWFNPGGGPINGTVPIDVPSLVPSEKKITLSQDCHVPLQLNIQNGTCNT